MIDLSTLPTPAKIQGTILSDWHYSECKGHPGEMLPTLAIAKYAKAPDGRVIIAQHSFVFHAFPGEPGAAAYYVMEKVREMHRTLLDNCADIQAGMFTEAAGIGLATR